MGKYIFTDIEKKVVKEAVQELEKESCGEIVPYFTQSSDDYTEASWYLATILGVIVLVSMAALSYLWVLPLRLTPFEVSIFGLFAMILGYVLPLLIPSLKRLIIPSSIMYERSLTRARDAFLREGVFDTEERVGVLIYVSMLEHQVLVLGDKGINEKVSQSDWDEVVKEVVKGIKSNNIGNGIVNAIEKCKSLLLSHGFVRKSNDYNELDDDLRIED